ncbi:MAG TPA: hypothetical protein VGS28_01765 [Candidatus Saccharimonadales bacterium]|nr:hypothetical protein [Candidatus Saccharimonadales bacterium]
MEPTNTNPNQAPSATGGGPQLPSVGGAPAAPQQQSSYYPEAMSTSSSPALGLNLPHHPDTQSQPPLQPQPAPPQGTPPQQQEAHFQQPAAQTGVANPQQKMQTPPRNQNSTQNLLEIAEIRDGIVIMNDGSFRAVILARSINFDLMSAGEKESVEYAYQNFLNSLYFPVQIVVRSRKVDMRPYLEKLNRIRTEQDNMLLALLMEDYIYYVSQLVEQTNIMSKQFYVVVPYFSEIKAGQVAAQTKGFLSGILGSSKQQLIINESALVKAKTELQNRVQSVVNGLLQLGVQAVPLDTQELIELYYDVYNPDTATRQPLPELNNMATVVVTKGVGNAKQPHLDGGAR